MEQDFQTRNSRFFIDIAVVAVVDFSFAHFNCRYAVVEELAGLGARVHTCARNESELEACKRNWESKGFQVSCSVCDVTSQAQRKKLMEIVSSEFNGKLNVLVSVYS